jgi:hypothetical protein
MNSPNEGHALDRLFARELARGPLSRTVVDDPELLAKTAHIRKPNESLLCLTARIGLGPRAMREWSLAKLQAWATQAEANNSEDSGYMEMNQPRPLAEGKYSAPGTI